MIGPYDSAAAFRQALEQRLRDQARETHTSLPRLTKAVSFDRFLARLGKTSSGWVMKGARALEYRFESGSRSTMDGDLVHESDRKTALEEILAAMNLDLGDGFSFRLESESAIPGDSLRVTVHAALAGRRFDEIVLDVAFADPVLWEPDYLTGPNLLGFVGIAPVEVPVLSLEQQVAEKVHAYTRRYGVQAARSSRPKDLVDLSIIARSAALNEDRLLEGLRVTFARRGTHSMPSSLPPPPEQWRIPYRVLATEAGIPIEMEQGFQDAQRLIDPVLKSLTPET